MPGVVEGERIVSMDKKRRAYWEKQFSPQWRSHLSQIARDIYWGQYNRGGSIRKELEPLGVKSLQYIAEVNSEAQFEVERHLEIRRMERLSRQERDKKLAWDLMYSYQQRDALEGRNDQGEIESVMIPYMDHPVAVGQRYRREVSWNSPFYTSQRYAVTYRITAIARNPHWKPDETDWFVSMVCEEDGESGQCGIRSVVDLIKYRGLELVK